MLAKVRQLQMMTSYHKWHVHDSFATARMSRGQRQLYQRSHQRQRDGHAGSRQRQLKQGTRVAQSGRRAKTVRQTEKHTHRSNPCPSNRVRKRNNHERKPQNSGKECRSQESRLSSDSQAEHKTQAQTNLTQWH